MSFLKFTLTRNTGKTCVWHVESAANHTFLGVLGWFAPWRRYVFRPAENTIFDALCIRELANFIDDRMNERRRERTGDAQ